MPPKWNMSGAYGQPCWTVVPEKVHRYVSFGEFDEIFNSVIKLLHALFGGRVVMLHSKWMRKKRCCEWKSRIDCSLTSSVKLYAWRGLKFWYTFGAILLCFRFLLEIERNITPSKCSGYVLIIQLTHPQDIANTRRCLIFFIEKKKWS